MNNEKSNSKHAFICLGLLALLLMLPMWGCEGTTQYPVPMDNAVVWGASTQMVTLDSQQVILTCAPAQEDGQFLVNTQVEVTLRSPRAIDSVEAVPRLVLLAADGTPLLTMALGKQGLVDNAELQRLLAFLPTARGGVYAMPFSALVTDSVKERLREVAALRVEDFSFHEYIKPNNPMVDATLNELAALLNKQERMIETGADTTEAYTTLTESVERCVSTYVGYREQKLENYREEGLFLDLFKRKEQLDARANR